MLQKVSWDAIPEEEVTPLMRRKLLYGDKLMIAKMKFKNGFVVPASPA